MNVLRIAFLLLFALAPAAHTSLAIEPPPDRPYVEGVVVDDDVSPPKND